MSDAIARCKRLASQTLFLALAEFAILCILLALLTLYLDAQTRPVPGSNEIVVAPTVLATCRYVAILCAVLLFLEAISLFLLSFARAVGTRWHLLSLLPFGLGIWFLLLAQRVQMVSQEIYRFMDTPTSHHGISPLIFSLWQTQAAQAITTMHTLGAVATGFTLLLLFLAWLELRLKPYGKYTGPACNESDLLNLAR